MPQELNWVIAPQEDLHKAKWAEIPRHDYVGAARFLTAHGMAYDGVVLNEERAASRAELDARFARLRSAYGVVAAMGELAPAAASADR